LNAPNFAKYEKNFVTSVAFLKVLLETIASNTFGCALPGEWCGGRPGTNFLPVRAAAKKCNTDMAQLFHRSSNFIARLSLLVVIVVAGVGLTAVLGIARAPYMTRQNITREQPVQFSHKHHVGDDGIDW